MNRKDCEYHAFNSAIFTGKDHTDIKLHLARLLKTTPAVDIN